MRIVALTDHVDTRKVHGFLKLESDHLSDPKAIVIREGDTAKIYVPGSGRVRPWLMKDGTKVIENYHLVNALNVESDAILDPAAAPAPVPPAKEKESDAKAASEVKG